MFGLGTTKERRIIFIFLLTVLYIPINALQKSFNINQKPL